MYQAFPIERDGKARNSKITTEFSIISKPQRIVKKNGNLLPIYV
jgi:archaellum component FlaG (FlaF/FlaG flagellin family)